MIVDGKAIASLLYTDLVKRVSDLDTPPRLTVFTCAPDLETRTYLKFKKEKAEMIGVTAEIIECAEEETTDSLIAHINTVAASTDGIIVQLPLPAHIDTDHVLASVPTTHDVDALNPHTNDIIPPVVGACGEILEYYKISITAKEVVVLGNGRLVGKPAAKWFTKMGATVRVLTRESEDIAQYTKQADIIVCGAGAPGFLKPDMVKEGAIILDAGTSEEGGVLRGDADPLCKEKSALMTPVPNGIGPVTIAILLKNLVFLTEKHRE